MRKIPLALLLASLSSGVHAAPTSRYCLGIMDSIMLRCVPGVPLEDYGADAVDACSAHHLEAFLGSERGDEIRANCIIDYLRPATIFRRASQPYRLRDRN